LKSMKQHSELIQAGRAAVMGKVHEASEEVKSLQSHVRGNAKGLRPRCSLTDGYRTSHLVAPACPVSRPLFSQSLHLKSITSLHLSCCVLRARACVI
jgi:hypothetical protein